jgi:hypothetical protein
MPYPHKKTHPMCDCHPFGYYNQAKARGIDDNDIPEEYRPPRDEGNDDFTGLDVWPIPGTAPAIAYRIGA